MVSCSSVGPPNPTPTPKPPTTTSSPSPFPTSTPTPTGQLVPTDFVETVPLPAAGFSFVPLAILHADLAPMQATMSNADQTFLLSLAAGTPAGSQTLD